MDSDLLASKGFLVDWGLGEKMAVDGFTKKGDLLNLGGYLFCCACLACSYLSFYRCSLRADSDSSMVSRMGILGWLAR